jgi:hypothetical protein
MCNLNAISSSLNPIRPGDWSLGRRETARNTFIGGQNFISKRIPIRTTAANTAHTAFCTAASSERNSTSCRGPVINRCRAHNHVTHETSQPMREYDAAPLGAIAAADAAAASRIVVARAATSEQ